MWDSSQLPVSGLTIALIVVMVVAGVSAIFAPPTRRRGRSSYGHFSFYWPKEFRHAGRQLYAVMDAPFQKRRIMNRSEYRVFKVIEDELMACRTGYRVFAQTSLGEVLESANNEAFHAINAKRVDVLVVDRGGWPILAVEYQGEGHHQGDAAARDAVKKEALRRAGVPYVEIFADDSDEQIRHRVHDGLGRATQAPAKHPALAH